MLIGMLFAGLGIYSILNTVVGFFIFVAAMDASGSATPTWPPARPSWPWSAWGQGSGCASCAGLGAGAWGWAS
ncbi:hypothetical protein ACFQQB_25180 [Nonomuraea rubra]|uniref:hypothetical protein n=1 Tax=Nonomuraea rubra TaxID=46180 RepID=UPI003617A78C